MIEALWREIQSFYRHKICSVNYLIRTGQVNCRAIHKNSGAVALVERRTGYLFADCAPKLKAGLVTDFIIRELRPIRGSVQTLTLDNGSEFADHQTSSKTLSLTSYFGDAFRSSQRDSNKNTNGLLRQYFPKGTDLLRQGVYKGNQAGRGQTE